MENRHAQDLLLYWSPKTAKDVVRREDILDYVASNQLKRADSGDVIWVVTAYDGELTLLGKLIVDVVTDRNKAVDRLGRRDVWGDKSHYAIAVRGKEEILREVPLRDVAAQLRFIASQPKSTRLHVDERNRVNAQELQTMRRLDSSSAQLLERLWKQR